MKYIINSASQFMAKAICLILASMIVVTGCEEYPLPEVGSIPDETPPTANFTYSPNEGDYKEIRFVNQSTSATTYMWDFGDGNTSTGQDVTNIYTNDGTYTVTLTASDALGQSSTYSEDIVIEEPVVPFTPEIMNPGFDIQGDDSYRDGWRNGDLGGVIQITSSPVHMGEKSAKLPSAGDRIGYQLITVLPDTEYTLKFYYTMKDDNPGTITVSMLEGHVTDPSEIAGKTIASFVGDDQSSPSDYVQGMVIFNSGSNTEVAIFFTNEGVECRIDTFTIEPN
ncbi:MAG: PKD domain-containing protein [Bacteroidota bacterium]